MAANKGSHCDRIFSRFYRQQHRNPYRGSGCIWRVLRGSRPFGRLRPGSSRGSFSDARTASEPRQRRL